jgi:hypothetical protein
VCDKIINHFERTLKFIDLALMIVVEVNIALAMKKRIRAEHNIVRAIFVEFLLIDSNGEELNIPTATVDFLLKFNAKRDNKSLPLVGEGFPKVSRNLVVTLVVHRLHSHVCLKVTVPFPSIPTPSSFRAVCRMCIGFNPIIPPALCESDVNDSQKEQHNETE